MSPDIGTLTSANRLSRATVGTLFFNPGSAGPRRFRLPITVGRMTVEHGKLHAEIVELSVEK